MDMQTTTDKPLEVSVSTQTTEGQQISLTLNEDLLVAAFIGFCSWKKIPISRQATKSVMKTDQWKISFDMTLQAAI